MGTLRYTSHDVVLEPETWQIRVGEEVIRPEPKLFEMLAYLMRNPGRVIPKAELLDSLWAGEVVGESVLTRCVSCIRGLLHDDARDPRFIRTAHGRGYQFIAPVSEGPEPASVAVSDARERASESPPGVADPRDGAFVGRAAETARLKAWMLAVASAPRARLALLTGEAGIGKTRLLQEATRTTPPGAEAYWGRASSIAGAQPFFVWRQCLRALVRERSLRTVQRAFGDSGGGARRLLLGTDAGQLDEQPGWDSPSHRFRIFDACTQAIAELARQRALVLVLDDLHSADLASLLLLEFVLDQLSAPVLLLGALRDTGWPSSEERHKLLSKIRAASHAEIPLAGLDRDEVRAFVERMPRGPHAPSVGDVHARTGGNPFFLSVLAPNFGQEPLPAAVRQAVTHRLSSLPAECVALLELAAVLGPDFDALALARAAQTPFARCLQSLRTACDARLIAATSPERFRFVHDLVREVLYDELGGDRRARAHLVVGRVLEALPEYQTAEQAAVLADHFAKAVDCGGASRALDLSIRAGAYALRNFAYEDAIEHFARAARLLPSCADTDPATESAVLLDLGLSQVSAGLREAGRATLRLVAAKAREQGSAEDLASVALGLAPGLLAIETGVYEAGLVEMLREALVQVGDKNDRLRALLLARLSLALYWADTFEERVRICEEAQALAERLATDEVRAAVTTARSLALLRPSNLEERRQLSERAIDLCRRVGDHHGLLLNRLLLGAMLLESGDRAAASFEADAFRQLAEETRQPQALWIVQAHHASGLLLDGRLDRVEELAASCHMAGQRTRDHNALLTFGVHFTLLRIEQERGGEVLGVIRDYAARYPRILGWRVLYAYALGRAGQVALRSAEYRSLKARGFALPDDLNWMVSMAWLAETCHLERDPEGAELLYQRLLPFAGRLVVIGYAGIACLGSVERYLGLLRAASHGPTEALEHLERAVRANRRTSAHLPLAYALCDYAGALLAVNGDRDHRDAARRCLDEAEAFACDRNLPALSTALRAARQSAAGRAVEQP